MLDQLAAETPGLKVVKVNTDEEPEVAGAYAIRSIPAVKLFRDGQVIDEFVGAQPLGAVRAFVEPHLPKASDLGLFVGVDLDHLQARRFGGKLIEHGSEHATRATPRRPKVDQHRLRGRGFDDFAAEVRGGDGSCCTHECINGCRRRQFQVAGRG
ncbi:MAG: thioredoxin [Gammaproteobacteria bacterium]|nr:thioredoxin [Gammaproteobacteria bacterium]